MTEDRLSLCEKISFERQNVNKDIKCVCSPRVEAFSRQKSFPPLKSTGIIQRLVEEANGTFLWVCVAMTRFAEIDIHWNTRSPDTKLVELSNLHPDLDNLCDRLVELLQSGDQAWSILRWLSDMRRPCYSHGLARALSIESTQTSLKGLVFPSYIKRSLGRLWSTYISIRQDASKATRIFTPRTLTRQFFQSASRPKLLAVHLEIAKTCLTYLCFTSTIISLLDDSSTRRHTFDDRYSYDPKLDFAYFAISAWSDNYEQGTKLVEMLWMYVCIIWFSAIRLLFLATCSAVSTLTRIIRNALPRYYLPAFRFRQ